MQSGPDDNRVPLPVEESFEDQEQHEAVKRRIMDEVRGIPITLNGGLIYNAIIKFVPASNLRPIDIRQVLQQNIVFRYDGQVKNPPIQRVNIYCHKGLLFLDYINEDPRLDDRLLLSNWPLEQILSMTIRKAGATPQRVAEFQSRQRPAPVRYQPSAERDEVMNQYQIEDMTDNGIDLKKKMMP